MLRAILALKRTEANLSLIESNNYSYLCNNLCFAMNQSIESHFVCIFW